MSVKGKVAAAAVIGLPVAALPFVHAGVALASSNCNPNNESPVTFQNEHSGNVLEVYSSATGNHAEVDQWSYNGTPTQFWCEYVPNQYDSSHGYHELINENSGKCLDVYNWGTGNGAMVDQWSCTGGANQLWRSVLVGKSGPLDIINVHSGKCLDDYNWNQNNGAIVDQWSCTGGTNQHWW